MLILKIKQKGLYIELPGLLPTRSPADIDITRCNLSTVDVYLRKNGITNYEISSSDDQIVKQKELKIEDSSIDQKVINKRFSKLEKMVTQLLEKEQAHPSKNREQITDKLDKIEILTKKILHKEPQVVKETIKTKKFKEPEIEELDDIFIPAINTSKMKLKGASKKTVKRETHDIDDSADLLSRIMCNDD